MVVSHNIFIRSIHLKFLCDTKTNKPVLVYETMCDVYDSTYVETDHENVTNADIVHRPITVGNRHLL